MNRQLSLALGPEPPAYTIAAALVLQQREEVENALADLLFNLAINRGTDRGGSDDE
jgi:thioredoxin-like negative regulator of GroEL